MIHIFTDGIQSSILIGWIYGIGAIGLGLIYKYLKFPDFTTIASLIFGSVSCVVFGQQNIFGGILASIIAGVFLGTITSSQIVFGKVPPIIAGIITWVISRTLAFKFSNDEATVSFVRERKYLDWIISSDFSWWSLFILFVTTLIICFLISQYFKRKYGVLTLAMFADEHYLKYRHNRKGITQFLLLIIGNGVIGLAGGLAAIQSNSATIQNHSEFLITALGAYALTNFFIAWINKKHINEFMSKENKPSSSCIFKAIIFISPWLKLADEKEAKIFMILILYVFFSIFITNIFMTANIYFGTIEKIQHLNFAIQGIILLAILLIPLLGEKLSKEHN